MNYMYLNKFFSKKNLKDFIFNNNFNPEIFKNELSKNYNILEKEYRNEFFFKSTLFNKYVLGKYSLSTTAALSEIVIESSKADLAIINHQKGTVYEIKTDLDNLDRLKYQLDNYYNVFSEVYVVTSEKNYYPVYRYIKEFKPSVGIIVLTKKVNLSLKKHATKDCSNLNHESLFKLLRKKEYEELLISKFGHLPQVKPVHYFKNCLELFKNIDVEEAQKLVFIKLRKRMDISDKEKFMKLPKPIRWIVYRSNFTDRELNEIYARIK